MSRSQGVPVPAVSRITWLSIAVGFLACRGIGIAFGVQPVRKAAHVDPVTTLRGRAA